MSHIYLVKSPQGGFGEWRATLGGWKWQNRQSFVCPVCGRMVGVGCAQVCVKAASPAVSAIAKEISMMLEATAAAAITNCFTFAMCTVAAKWPLLSVRATVSVPILAEKLLGVR